MGSVLDAWWPRLPRRMNSSAARPPTPRGCSAGGVVVADERGPSMDVDAEQVKKPPGCGDAAQLLAAFSGRT